MTKARNYPDQIIEHALIEVDFAITASRYRPIMFRGGGWNGNAEVANETMGGAYVSSNTVDGIEIFPGSGSIVDGIFSLYGMSK